jgi:hypothetical protein
MRKGACRPLFLGRRYRAPDEPTLLHIAASTDRDRIGLGTALSLALHAAALLVLLQLHLDGASTGRLEESAPVEVWTPEEFDAVSGAKEAAPVDPQPRAPAPTADPTVSQAPPQNPVLPLSPSPEPQEEAGGNRLIHPGRMLSGTVLADPRSRQALAILPSLDDETRAEQLCDIEAMAQIAAWRRQYRPDRVVAYAMAEVKAEGGALLADGAAFRSNRGWFALRFRCTLSPDRRSISDFAFSVGAPVPRRDWEAHGLSPVY